MNRIGCVLVLVPIGGAVLIATAEVFKVPVSLLLLGIVLFAVWPSGGSTPTPAHRATPRRRSIYERTRHILTAYDEGRISEESRDRQLMETQKETQDD